jgi:hypothetical protein
MSRHCLVRKSIMVHVRSDGILMDPFLSDFLRESRDHCPGDCSLSFPGFCARGMSHALSYNEIYDLFLYHAMVSANPDFTVYSGLYPNASLAAEISARESLTSPRLAVVNCSGK